MKLITKIGLAILIAPNLFFPLLSKAQDTQISEVASTTSAYSLAVSKITDTFPDDADMMLKILTCESNLKQFNASGTPLISPTNDVGIAQINIKTWGFLAEVLGLDIYNNIDDNLAMAKIIYDVQSLNAWTCYSMIK